MMCHVNVTYFVNAVYSIVWAIKNDANLNLTVSLVDCHNFSIILNV